MRKDDIWLVLSFPLIAAGFVYFMITLALRTGYTAGAHFHKWIFDKT